MALGVPGDVVTFLLDGTTTHAGVVIGSPDTTHNTVAYDFACPGGGRLVHCKEYDTTAVTEISAVTD